MGALIMNSLNFLVRSSFFRYVLKIDEISVYESTLSIQNHSYFSHVYTASLKDLFLKFSCQLQGFIFWLLLLTDGTYRASSSNENLTCCFLKCPPSFTYLFLCIMLIQS